MKILNIEIRLLTAPIKCQTRIAMHVYGSYGIK